MNGLHVRYPCHKCTHEADHAWLLRDLRNAIAEARLRGMHECDLPSVYVDCEDRYTPLPRVRRR